MVVLDWGKSQTALLLAGSITIVPTYFIIGTGSGVVTSGQTALITASDRQLTTSIDATTAFHSIFTGDWTTVEMSGLQLQEFGLIISGGGLTGSIWSRTNLPAITFDGTNELQIVEDIQVF